MGGGLECPECGGSNWKVMQSGSSEAFGGSFWRRRKCKDCGEMTHTYELTGEILEIMGVKK